MEGIANNITATALTIEKQIEILLAVRESFKQTAGRPLTVFTGYKMGLCFYFKNILGCHMKEISEYIPLFNYENAKKQANAKMDENNYWWGYENYDFKHRLEFLEWMLFEVEKQFKKQITI